MNNTRNTKDANNVKNTNKRTAIVTLSIGGVIALVALVLAFDIGGVASLVPTAAKAVWGFAGCAFALLICGILALVHKTTPQEAIEQSDERNQAIGNLAARKAFTFMTVFTPIVGLVLFVLDQVSLAAMLVIIATEVVALAAYAIAIARLQRTM